MSRFPVSGPVSGPGGFQKAPSIVPDFVPKSNESPRVGMGVGNDKVGRGVGNGVGCEGGQDMGLSMTGRLPNPIFEGDFHPMPSGWAETKLSSRHGDEEHAVVPQPAAPFIGSTKAI